MADVVSTITQIEDFFQEATVKILGLDPSSKAAQKRVRTSWPEKGAPAWKREDDVAFLMVTFADDLITRQMEATYSESSSDMANRTISYTRVIQVSWICYGPSSFGDADLIRSGLFLPRTTEDLAAINMALITDVPMPTRTPELFNGQWWDRSSFYARFNEKVIRQSEIPYLQSADVQIKQG